MLALLSAAGVGAPDETYAVICEPKAGTDLDPHEVKPWKWDSRKPVRLVNPAADRTNLSASCYYYDAVPGDTASSIADSFLLDIRRFAQDNTQVFKPVTVSVDYNETLTSDEVTATLVNIKGSQRFLAAAEPYFRCTDAAGSTKECRVGGGSSQLCAGETNCSLFYQEPDVSINPAGQALLVCGISSAPGQFDAVARFDDPAVSQPRALRRLLDEYGYYDVPVPWAYCNPETWTDPRNPRAPAFTNTWVTACDDGFVTELSADIGPADNPYGHLRLDQRLADVLLLLEKVEILVLFTSPGSSIPPQLGALTQMSIFIAYSWCWKGTLPANLGRGWPDLEILRIEQQEEPTKQCGIEGTLPEAWGRSMRRVGFFELSNNRLAGSLPPEYAQMSELRYFDLRDNQLGGVLPSSYSNWPYIADIRLQGNDIRGEIHPAWSVLSDTLQTLTLSNNPK